ncbi:MAG: carbohydrate-binding domain-containing protein [Candidatus Omnitrophota bacterium]|jgi:hypothetical protein
MKKTVNFILIIFFIFLATVVIFLFSADWQFNSVKRLESGYLWQRAEEKYQLAISLDPFNAQYFAGYGDFLRNKSVYQKDRTDWLMSAEKLYAHALRLNPYSADYALNSGITKLQLFLLDKDKFKNRLYSGLNDLKRAVKNDPNGSDTNYTAGCTGILIWNDLHAPDKEWVLSVLKQNLKTMPENEEYIYSQLWKIAKDYSALRKIRPIESAQEKKEKLKRIEKIRQGNSGQAWQGKSKDGVNVYENGNMYWTGTVDMLINLPNAKSTIKIQAKGSPTDDIWPHMIVELDGEEIGEIFVESPEWKEYVFQVDTKGGGKVLSVTFANDGGNAKEDRNLYLGDVSIE